MALDQGIKLTKVRAFLSVTSEVARENTNLSPPEKELLKWHYKLGHVGFNKVKFLMNTGGLATNDSCKKIYSCINKVIEHPKCAACIYALAVLHAVHLVNHIANPRLGHSPFENQVRPW